MDLTPHQKRLRNKLIAGLNRTHPERGYCWAVEAGCQLMRETIAEAEARGERPSTQQAAEKELTAADFLVMTAEQLEALILKQ